MKDAERNAKLEEAAEACERIEADFVGLAGTCNDWKRKLEYDSGAAVAKKCAAAVRALKTEKKDA